jgi:hypothetical protein
MSTVCRILGLSSDQVAMLRGKPMLAADAARVSMHDETASTVRRAMAGLPMAERIAFAARRQPEEALIAIARKRLRAFEILEPTLSLGTTWHILHYVFTGRAQSNHRKPWHYFLTHRVIPLYDPADSLMNGEPVGEDLGYGPAMLQDEARTEEFCAFLEAQDIGDLQARVHFRKMTWLGIHALPFGPRDSSDFANDVRAQVAAYFPLLRQYVSGAAAKRGGLLIWLS